MHALGEAALPARHHAARELAAAACHAEAHAAAYAEGACAEEAGVGDNMHRALKLLGQKRYGYAGSPRGGAR